jgi:hypothetical protein
MELENKEAKTSFIRLEQVKARTGCCSPLNTGHGVHAFFG